MYLLDKGGCWCLKNGLVWGLVEVFVVGSVFVLYFVVYWVYLIKFVEGEKKNDVVVDLLWVVVRLKVEVCWC